MSLILVMLMSDSDSNLQHSNISFKENKHDGVVDLSSNGLNYCTQKNEKNSTVFGKLNSKMKTIMVN